MGIHEIETSHPGSSGVSACTIESARLLADSVERRDQRRNGGSREEARARVARRLGWSPGTLYNLTRDRLKRLDRDLRDQLAAYAIKDLENEIAALNTELERTRLLGGEGGPSLAHRVEAVLAEAQSLHARLNGGAA